LRNLDQKSPNESKAPNDKKSRRIDIYSPKRIFDAHSALNISLFPPLFFFSSLYYTDVISTLLVILSYNIFVKNLQETKTWRKGLASIYIGITALSFRQTNIFWVAVFPAGLALVKTLRTSDKPNTDRTAASIIKKSWHESYVYDCRVQDAGLLGKCLTSLCIQKIII